ncbi:nickel-responsive transcriptional regulator NikR [Ralstonia pseudosolanacearum]|uniref:nickel-responsive transcriptional regulator NikR n=1 Tax=Ralstonia pseudosolanacearum TaxID=1310165 RepID=UPI0024A79964|nr:nickel-responsive transcriptional regulator NikR [Ralstonia pseudosolanacearum]
MDAPVGASFANHHEREVAERLTRIQHAHHGPTVSTMHAQLNDEHCIETVILRGPASAVRRLADAISSERGVKRGQLNPIMTSVEPDEAGQGQHAHHHQH